MKFSPKLGSFKKNEGQIRNQWRQMYLSEHIHCEYNNLFQGGMVPLTRECFQGWGTSEREMLKLTNSSAGQGGGPQERRSLPALERHSSSCTYVIHCHTTDTADF